MRILGALLICLVLGNPVFSDTLDWRDCTPHSAADTAAYRGWLTQFFDDQSKADALAASYQRGDAHWSGTPCNQIGTLERGPLIKHILSD